MMSPINTRRWHRHQVDLPVSIIALNGILTTPVPARASEISRAGMALHAPVDLNPGDVMHIQFPTSSASPRVKALVRNRRGQCLGLEFLTQLPPDSEPKERSRLIPAPPFGLFRNYENPYRIFTIRKPSSPSSVESRKNSSSFSAKSTPLTWRFCCLRMMKTRSHALFHSSTRFPAVRTNESWQPLRRTASQRER